MPIVSLAFVRSTSEILKGLYLAKYKIVLQNDLET